MTDPPVLRLLARADDRPTCGTPGCSLPALSSAAVSSHCARVYRCALALCRRLLLRELLRQQHDIARQDATPASGTGRGTPGPWPHGLQRLDGHELDALDGLVAELCSWDEVTT